MNLINKLLVLALLIAPVFLSARVYAANGDDPLFTACTAKTKDSPVCKSRDTTKNPIFHIIKITADVVALITGAAAVVFIILGGLTMVTSSGNPEAVANARKRIIYAVIGLVIVSFAWLIISFVLDKLVK